MSSKMEKRFGGAVEEALRAVVNSAPHSISVADASTREAFIDAWVRTLSAHANELRLNSKTLKSPVLLVYVPDTSMFGKDNNWEQRSMLGSSHRDDFSGILAVGTSEAGGYVYPVKLSDTKEFELVIRRANLESAPTIALMSEEKLVIWPDGIEAKPSPFQGALSDSAVVIDLNAIDIHLNHFYEEVGRQTKKWWQNAQLRTTVFHLETTIQYELWVYLQGQFGRAARIKIEESIGNGRADITIVPISSSIPNQSAVLELKALRDVHTPKKAGATPTNISKKENIKWACSGISQTAAYRDHNKMDGAFLCLYDFCAGNNDAIEKKVKPDAEKYDVLCRRYWISGSNTEHREDRYPLTS